MHLEVTLDLETSEHAGAGGMYQIESVRNAETDEDLTSKVDVGMHFDDEEGGSSLDEYLKSVFGPGTTYDVVD